MASTLGFSSGFTKYHGGRAKVAVVNVPGRGAINLCLSDTHRCAKEDGAALATLQNIAKDSGIDMKASAEALRAHCRQLLGIQEDPKPRR